MARRTSALAAAAALAALALSGCGRIGAAVLGGPQGGPVDAHTVARTRAGCSAVGARTLDHGWTVLSPALAPDRAAVVADSTGAPVAGGLFEGPVREGAAVFRYLAPGEGESWATARPTDVPVVVHAVRVDLPDVRVWLDRLCGPLVPGEPGEATIPRTPGRPAPTETP